jgi:hypothetical protein
MSEKPATGTLAGYTATCCQQLRCFLGRTLDPAGTWILIAFIRVEALAVSSHTRLSNTAIVALFLPSGFKLVRLRLRCLGSNHQLRPIRRPILIRVDVGIHA